MREFSRDKKVAAVAFDRAARLGSVTPRRLQNEQKAAPFPLCSLSLSLLSGVELRPISIYLFHPKVGGVGTEGPTEHLYVIFTPRKGRSQNLVKKNFRHLH